MLLLVQRASVFAAVTANPMQGSSVARAGRSLQEGGLGPRCVQISSTNSGVLAVEVTHGAGLPSVHALRERRAQLEAAGAAGGPHIAAAATAAPAGSDAPAHAGDATSTGATVLVEMAGGVVGGDGGGAAAAPEGAAWLPEEDALIVDAVRRVGFQWRAIAALLGVRSDGERGSGGGDGCEPAAGGA